MTTTKTIKSTAAMFGAALTSIYAAPNLQADVVDLTFSPTTVAFSSSANIVLGTVSGISLGTISVTNFESTSIGFNLFSDIDGLRAFALSERIVAGAVDGDGGIPGQGQGFDNSNGLPSQSAIIGFRIDDNAGYFTVNFGDSGPIEFTGGVFGNEGEDLLAGVGEAPPAVPEPASGLALAALALGAAGVRRRRQVA